MNKSINPSCLVSDRFSQLETSHPDWMNRYETADFSSGITEELISLLSSAPVGFAAGLIYGKLTVMQQVAGMPTLRIASRIVDAPTVRDSHINLSIPTSVRIGVNRPPVSTFERASIGH